MKKKFTVLTYWTAAVDKTVEAKDEDEAMELAIDLVDKDDILAALQYDTSEIID